MARPAETPRFVTQSLALVFEVRQLVRSAEIFRQRGLAAFSAASLRLHFDLPLALSREGFIVR